MRKLIFLCFLTLLSCSNGDRDDLKEKLNRPNCGEIVRIWSQNTSFDEGNPCGNNIDSSRNWTIQVKNQITGNIKNFCVNTSVVISYDLGDIYCDEFDPSGW